MSVASVQLGRVAQAVPGDVIAFGRLLDVGGHPLGGRVTAFVFNDDGFNDDGQRSEILLFPIAEAYTGADGTFSLSAPFSGEVRAAAESRQGFLNIVLLATDGQLAQTFSVSRRFEGGRWLGMDLEQEALELSLVPGVAAAYSSQLPGKSDPEQASGSMGQVEPTACGGIAYVALSTSDQNTVVGEIHTKGDTTATFTYGARADSDIDVGWSSSSTGPWSINGSIHVGNSGGSAATWTAGANTGRKLLSTMRYTKYRVQDGCGRIIGYEIRATSWRGGALWGDDVSALDGKCNSTYYDYRAAFGKNTAWTRSQNQAYKFGGAFSVYGFSAGARSGFSSYVKSRWSFGSNVNYHYLCGNDGPVTESHRVFAGPNSNTQY